MDALRPPIRRHQLGNAPYCQKARRASKHKRRSNTVGVSCWRALLGAWQTLKLHTCRLAASPISFAHFWRSLSWLHDPRLINIIHTCHSELPAKFVWRAISKRMVSKMKIDTNFITTLLMPFQFWTVCPDSPTLLETTVTYSSHTVILFGINFSNQNHRSDFSYEKF